MGVEEKIWIDLTQAFLDFTWLKKSRWEYLFFYKNGYDIILKDVAEPLVQITSCP